MSQLQVDSLIRGGEDGRLGLAVYRWVPSKAALELALPIGSGSPAGPGWIGTYSRLRFSDQTHSPSRICPFGKKPTLR